MRDEVLGVFPLSNRSKKDYFERVYDHPHARITILQGHNSIYYKSIVENKIPFTQYAINWAYVHIFMPAANSDVLMIS